MKRIRQILAILVVLTGFASSYLGIFYVSASSIDSGSLMEKINRERTNRNIPALASSSKLTSAATAKTADMFSRTYFDHVDPDGRYVWFRIEAAGYMPYKTLGENLAMDFSSEDGIIRAWINSPSHRDNLLRADFEDQGLNSQYGTYDTRYTNIATSLFGALIASVQAPPPVKQSSPKTFKSRPAPQAPTPPAAVKNEENASKPQPAILLVQNPSEVSTGTANTLAGTQEISFPQNIVGAETNVYDLVRLIFIILVGIWIVTFIIDTVNNATVRRLLKKDGRLPLLLLLILVSLLTLNLY